MPPTTPPKPRRRWLRFSLGTMMLVITLLSIWLGLKVSTARIQKEAVIAICTTDGVPFYDYEVKSVPDRPGNFTRNANASPPGPTWLSERLGNDYFCDVIAVHIEGAKSLAQLDKLPALQYVRIWDVTYIHDDKEQFRPIQGSDLAVLERLPRLHSLSFCKINDSEISCVAKLKHLKHLHLQYADDITDKGMEAIGNMVGLESLCINGAEITDVGLMHLRNLKKLEYLDLNLHSLQISDAGMVHIGNMPALRHLCLADTQITDAGLSNLQSLTNLDELDLSANAITDAGLQYLKRLKKLKTLDLGGTQVTPDGIRELQKSLPNTKIEGP